MMSSTIETDKNVESIEGENENKNLFSFGNPPIGNSFKQNPFINTPSYPKIKNLFGDSNSEINQNLKTFKNKIPSIFLGAQDSKQFVGSYKTKIFDIKLDVTNIQESSKFLFDDMQCPICLYLLVDPESCNKCNTLFCAKCIFESLKSEKKICPLRCTNIKLQPANLNLKRILGKVKVICPLCGIHMLNEEISNHLVFCDNNVFICSSRDCLFEGNKKQIHEHILNCQYLEIKCEACNYTYLRKDTKNHIENICPDSLIKCGFCEAKMKRKFEKFHSKEECFDLAFKNKNNEIEELKKKISKLMEENK